MPKSRGLDQGFLSLMRAGLERGRRNGYLGWDSHWEDGVFPCGTRGSRGYFFQRLMGEIGELHLALHEGDPRRIAKEAADVANLAMMVADVHKEGD